MESKDSSTSAITVRKSIFAKKKAPTDTVQQGATSLSSTNLLPSASAQLPSLFVAAVADTSTQTATPPHSNAVGFPAASSPTSSSTQPGKRRSLFGRKVQASVDEASLEKKVVEEPEVEKSMDFAEVEDVAETLEKSPATHNEVEILLETSDNKLQPTEATPSAVVVTAESDSSINSTDRPQTPAMPQSITLSRFMMKVCEITGRLIPVLSEKVAGHTYSSSNSEHRQQSMMGMTESYSAGGDDDDDEDGVFNNNVPPMLAYLQYLPYSHYMDAPVPRALLRTTTRTTTTNSNHGFGDVEQLPQSVRPLSRLVVGLVDTTLGGAVMADAIVPPPVSNNNTCYHETSRPTSPTTSSPLNNLHPSSSFAEARQERSTMGTKRSRTSLDGGAEVDDEGNTRDGTDPHMAVSSRPLSPQVLNTSFGQIPSVSGGGVGGGAVTGSCPSSLYSPGYPSTTHTSTLLGSQHQKYHHPQHHSLIKGSSSSSTFGMNNPFYVPVGFGVVPPNVVCRGIQEPVYLTLRFEKCLAACYTVCAKVVPEMQLGWSVHSTTMFYCHVFIRAHFWQDPESLQQPSEISCSPRRRTTSAAGGRNMASSPTTANPSKTATPTKPTTPTCPPPSFYDVPSSNSTKPPPPPQQSPISQPTAPIEMKRLQTMDPIVLVAAALFLATKIENFKTPLNEIIGRIFDRHPNRPEHAKYKAMVLQAEIMLLATLGGNMTVIHPFDEIRQLSMGNQEVAKRANKLYSYTTMTPVALYVPRRELAASLVLLVAEEAKLLPSSSASSSMPRSGSVRSASGNRPTASANPFVRLLNGTSMTEAEIDAGLPRPVALTAAHFETVMACLSAMMLVTEKRSGVARLDNRVQVKKSLIAHSEYARLQRNNMNAKK